MALEEITIKVQEYMGIPESVQDGTIKVSFDTDKKISELIEELSKKQQGPPLDKKYLAIYDENGEECEGD